MLNKLNAVIDMMLNINTYMASYNSKYAWCKITAPLNETQLKQLLVDFADELQPVLVNAKTTDICIIFIDAEGWDLFTKDIDQAFANVKDQAAKDALASLASVASTTPLVVCTPSEDASRCHAAFMGIPKTTEVFNVK